MVTPTKTNARTHAQLIGLSRALLDTIRDMLALVEDPDQRGTSMSATQLHIAAHLHAIDAEATNLHRCIGRLRP